MPYYSVNGDGKGREKHIRRATHSSLVNRFDLIKGQTRPKSGAPNDELRQKMIDLTDDGLMSDGFYLAVKIDYNEMVYIGPTSIKPIGSDYFIHEINMTGKVWRHITIQGNNYQESGLL